MLELIGKVCGDYVLYNPDKRMNIFTSSLSGVQYKDYRVNKRDMIKKFMLGDGFVEMYGCIYELNKSGVHLLQVIEERDVFIPDFVTSFENFLFDKFHDRLNLSGGAGLISLNELFSLQADIKLIDMSRMDVSNVTSMIKTFNGCNKLKEIILPSTFTDKLTYLDKAFHCCRQLVDIDFGNMNVTNVESIDKVFCTCNALKSLNLSSLHFENLKYCSGAFANCRNLRNLSLSGISSPYIELCDSMFEGCALLNNLDLTNFMLNPQANYDYIFARVNDNIHIKCNDKFVLDLFSKRERYSHFD